jgi:hypothetical protein
MQSIDAQEFLVILCFQNWSTPWCGDPLWTSVRFWLERASLVCMTAMSKGSKILG